MTDFSQLEGRLLVVYDGECGFCNQSIRWLLRRDRKDHLRFAPSTDPGVVELLAAHGMQPFGAYLNPAGERDFGRETMLVFRNIGTPIEELLVRSNAILACLRVLPQPWRMLGALLRIIPRPFREAGYRFVARERYRIWGRYDVCPVPTPEERGHFL
jgi:predicted DCC family thiol-disulfide oxidoreductase YuxK